MRLLKAVDQDLRRVTAVSREVATRHFVAVGEEDDFVLSRLRENEGQIRNGEGRSPQARHMDLERELLGLSATRPCRRPKCSCTSTAKEPGTPLQRAKAERTSVSG